MPNHLDIMEIPVSAVSLTAAMISAALIPSKSAPVSSSITAVSFFSGPLSSGAALGELYNKIRTDLHLITCTYSTTFSGLLSTLSSSLAGFSISFIPSEFILKQPMGNSS